MWGGSSAFLDTRQGSIATTHLRAYLITEQQFEDVVAQENGRSAFPFVETLPALAFGETERLGVGRYETVMGLGAIDGIPILTFTAPWTLDETEVGTPSVAYLTTLANGLREPGGLSEPEILQYLAMAPGCSEDLARLALWSPIPLSADRVGSWKPELTR